MANCLLSQEELLGTRNLVTKKYFMAAELCPVCSERGDLVRIMDHPSIASLAHVVGYSSDTGRRAHETLNVVNYTVTTSAATSNKTVPALEEFSLMNQLEVVDDPMSSATDIFRENSPLPDRLQSNICKSNKSTKCHHGKSRYNCKDCKGKRICPHGRIKFGCKECGGSSICIHNRERAKCKECGGKSICEHGRVKPQCKDCGGASICIHGLRKNYCRKGCGGSSICVHDRDRAKCKDCKGSSVCIHDRQKSQCKDCGGASICVHNKRRSYCRECGGHSICKPHGRYKNKCRECGGKNFCHHGRQRRLCKECKVTHNVLQQTLPISNHLSSVMNDPTMNMLNMSSLVNTGQMTMAMTMNPPNLLMDPANLFSTGNVIIPQTYLQRLV